MSKKSVAIVGASGYTGAELIRLLCAHPNVELVSVSAGRAAGKHITEVFPQLTGLVDLRVTAFDPLDIAERAAIVFCALPHGQSAEAVFALHTRGLCVLDLSADYRLRDAAAYPRWYGNEHPHPELLEHAVYGLPEFHRSLLPGARLVAVPGCYPTGAILALAPLLRAQLVKARGVVIDAKSGVTGAGRNPSSATHFPEVGEGLRAYKVGGVHRHTPEIEQELGIVANDSIQITFTPHLAPMSRGIFSCVYAEPTDTSLSGDRYHAELVSCYETEPFVQVLPFAQAPDTSHVRGSNQAHVSVAYDARTHRVIAMSAIDNLVKGASGQAVQCMNLTQGWDQTLGLTHCGIFP